MSRRNSSVLPIFNQYEIDRALAKLASMKPEKIFKISVRAGIYTKNGQLTEHYADDESSAYRSPDPKCEVCGLLFEEDG